MNEAKEILKEHVQGYREAVRAYKRVLSNGTDDPFWPDGVQANIHRSEAIYHRARILSLCKEEGLPVPSVLRSLSVPERADTLHQSKGSPRRPLFERVKHELLQGCS
jgi:hypothetical protein